MTLRREDRGDGVAVLVIDRPEARNALSPEIRSGFAEHFAGMAGETAVRAVVITGAGGHFCAGGDVKTMGSRDPSAMEDRLAEMARVAELAITFPKPVVAAVRGHAAGAGASIACLADVVVAGDSAKFTVSFLNIGLVPDWGLTYTLPRRVGLAAARRLALTRERVDADEAHRLGVADVRAPDGEVMAVALERARTLAASALGGYAALKAMMEDREALRAALRAEARTQIERSRTWEHREGVAAFREKRRPDFVRAAAQDDLRRDLADLGMERPQTPGRQTAAATLGYYDHDLDVDAILRVLGDEEKVAKGVLLRRIRGVPTGREGRTLERHRAKLGRVRPSAADPGRNPP